MRLLVTGSLDFNDEDLLTRKLNSLTRNLKELTLLVYAREAPVRCLVSNWARTRMRPWKVYYEGEDPLADADGLVVFRKGQDKATNRLLVKATFARVKIRVVELK